MEYDEMSPDGTVAAFDYGSLDTESRIVVQQRTGEIRDIAHRATQDIVEIGARLIEVKARLGHGLFSHWLRVEFKWSQDTAGRFMNVARRFPEIPHGAEIEPSALYELAKPSTPEQARQDVLLALQEPGPITKRDVMRLKRQYSQAATAEEQQREASPPYRGVPIMITPGQKVSDPQTYGIRTVEREPDSAPQVGPVMGRPPEPLSWDDLADAVSATIATLGTEKQVRVAAGQLSPEDRASRGQRLRALAVNLNALARATLEDVPSPTVREKVFAIEAAVGRLGERTQRNQVVARWDKQTRAAAQPRIRSVIQTLQAFDEALTAKDGARANRSLPEGYVAPE